MDETPQCWLHRDLSKDQAMMIGRLIATTWPNPEKDVAHRAESLLKLGRLQDTPDELSSRSWVMMDFDTCIAHAAMQPREIIIGNQKLWVMGLAAVCTDMTLRGRGLGAKIVKAAFGMIDSGAAAFSLFQTSDAVRPFYENLGASVVEDRVFNSTAKDPKANPFWDSVVMRYPAGEGWPAGDIDLQGPGY